MHQIFHASADVVNDAADVLSTHPPALSADEAQRFAWEWYGLRVRVSALNGERDLNFLAVGEDGRKYVLKFVNAAEPRDVTNFQTEVLLHLGRRDPSLPVPRVVAARDGRCEPELECGGQRIVMRLVSYLEGVPLHNVTPGIALMSDMGTVLARLDRALADFSHPAAARDLLWNISHVPRLASRLDYVVDPRRRASVQRFFDHFGARVAPRLTALRHQVIHNDMNPQNVMVDARRHDRLGGIIDFGDALVAPMINDLATALAYHVSVGQPPFEGMQACALAYHRVVPLEAAEIELLPELVRARLALIIAISHWRAASYPGNAAYILRNNARAWEGFERMDALTPAAAASLFRPTLMENS
ncbi:phosphotransferase [Paraburkholderia acidisoli]|uniref:Hydroxylysine kinase n=2 Tax=Paraburkholderia acidisoli TaxID=2571748 RepID=A0A7Z2GMK2_9BURK|nr:phosphotransferase [Paraburkholderia acidisoli]